MTDTRTTDDPACRHEWQCEGWTVGPGDSTCRVCGRMFVFWSGPVDPGKWEPAESFPAG